jgi:hypothetical protein
MKKKPKQKPDLEAAILHLVRVNRGLIKAQMINTEKLNSLVAMAEDDQKQRHLDHDAWAGMPQLELVDEEAQEYDWNV